MLVESAYSFSTNNTLKTTAKCLNMTEVNILKRNFIKPGYDYKCNIYPLIPYLLFQETSSGFGRNFANNRSESNSKKILEVAPKKQPTILIKAREPTNEEPLPKSCQKEETKASVPTSKDTEGKAFNFLYFFHNSNWLDLFAIYK